MNYKNYLLFTTCSLIWGTTWFVIKFQLESTSPIVGVFYRFLVAAILMFIFNFFISKKNIYYPLKNHLFFFLQGIFNFSINYILTYVAEQRLSSGLVALTFTSLVYFNMIGLRIWFKKPISKNVFWGGFVGAFGIALLFLKEILNFNLHTGPITGILIGIIATFFGSTGNMFAYKNHLSKVPVTVYNTYSMLYGALFSLMIGLLQHENFIVSPNSNFIFSLFYLSIFGSVIGFWAYQTLAGNIGADKAAYSSIIAPMMAIIISSIYEDIHFTPLIISGIIFCLLGNVISLKKAI